MNIPASDQEAQHYMAAFQQGLQRLGWSVGRNVQIDHRWGPSAGARLQQQVAELLALAPDVMLVAGGNVAEVIRSKVAVPIVLSQPSTRSAAALSRAWRGRAET